MSIEVMEQTRQHSFDERMVQMLNGAAVMLMTSVGHRTGLFDTMADMEPATTQEIARQAGLNERYVREWLGAMVTGGVIEHNPEDETYVLPSEHASWLTRRAAPNNIAATTQFIAVLGAVEDEVVQAFKHGKGVPYSSYKHFHRVMAEESDQTVVAGLTEHILPLVPSMMQRLEAGIDVLDVGCGSGHAMIDLAARYPRSHFTGFDFSSEAIGYARAEAARQGLTNVRFEVRDVAAMEVIESFDFITAFDAIHDQARPDLVLANIRRGLRSDGVFLMQDIKAHSHVHMNLGHGFAPFIYTISCMHCMSVSLANDGMGLGAAWGKQKALEMLREAGFRDVLVEELEHDMMNYYYIAGKTR